MNDALFDGRYETAVISSDGANDSPERRFCAALLTDAIEAATGIVQARPGARWEAQQWLKAEDDAWLIPCGAVCDFLGLDQAAVVERLLPRFVEAQPEQPKKKGPRPKTAEIITIAPRRSRALADHKCRQCDYKTITKRGMRCHTAVAHGKPPLTLDALEIKFRLRMIHARRGFHGANGEGEIFTVLSNGNARSGSGMIVKTTFEQIVEDAENEVIAFVVEWEDEGPADASRATRKRYLRKLRDHFTTDSTRSTGADSVFLQTEMAGR